MGSSLVSIKVLCIFCSSYNIWSPVNFEYLQTALTRVISTVIAMTLPKIVTTIINNTLTKKKARVIAITLAIVSATRLEEI